MAWSDWSSYSDLLNRLWDQRDSWRDARTLDELVEKITSAQPGLLGGDERSQVGEHGLTALIAALSADHSDPEALHRRLRLAALARPAADHGFGSEWAGRYVTLDADGKRLHSTDRYAEPAGWAPVDAPAEARPAKTFDSTSGLYYDATSWYLPDETTPVTRDPAHPTRSRDAQGTVYVQGVRWAPGEQNYDAAAGRWGRLDPSGEFEYFHDEDQVWERQWDHGWTRLNPVLERWLPHDRASGTWLHEGAWRTAADIDALVAPKVQEPVVPPAPQAEPAAADRAVPEPESVPEPGAATGSGEVPPEAVEVPPEVAAEVVDARSEVLEAAIAEIRAANVSPEELSDAAIAAMLDAQTISNLEQ
ncbi:hypothetical protein [Actinokineospora bangkokensis]|uniref:Uncharacterized protein n=1 Tax=Actinokineospora bangkokensis TaxID=1193682 RepID=A0A1Q9LN79_9PSEU|nr:hypothetical protein [Actinokineospora bangkokensis]OLR93507.1 hypothetical protein BJP25_14480 [Actinokineospora bangkokensis]